MYEEISNVEEKGVRLFVVTAEQADKDSRGGFQTRPYPRSSC